MMADGGLGTPSIRPAICVVGCRLGVSPEQAIHAAVECPSPSGLVSAGDESRAAGQAAERLARPCVMSHDARTSDVSGR